MSLLSGLGCRPLETTGSTPLSVPSGFHGLAFLCCPPIAPPSHPSPCLQVYLDAELLKNEGDVLRDAERAFAPARGRLLDAPPAIEAAADLVWDEVQVWGPLATRPAASLAGTETLLAACDGKRVDGCPPS